MNHERLPTRARFAVSSLCELAEHPTLAHTGHVSHPTITANRLR